ncbi:hypothetical protein KAW11_01415 [Candidatus Bathyarchaeota archaeon]|nr:hypothetical protein [Candidatus Bathyarchaeota archaeon]
MHVGVEMKLREIIYGALAIAAISIVIWAAIQTYLANDALDQLTSSLIAFFGFITLSITIMFYYISNMKK